MQRNTYITAIFSTILVASFLATPQTTFAQDASDSGRTNQEIKKRIDRVIEEKKQAVAGAIAKIKNKKRGFVGPIERVNESSITITTHKGPLVLPLNDSVQVLKKSKKMPITDLVVGNWVVALGIETDGMFAPKYILRSDYKKPKTRVVLLGTITVMKKSGFTLLTRGSSESKNITSKKTTNYQNSDGSKITARLLEKDLTVLVVGNEDEQGQIIATTIRSLAPLGTSK